MNKKLLRKKLALVLANLKKKRPYFCEVEYLESTGTQYIDTGYIQTSTNIKFETHIYTPNMPSTEQDIFGYAEPFSFGLVMGLYQKRVFLYTRQSVSSGGDTNVISTAFSGERDFIISGETNESLVKTLTVNGTVYTGTMNAQLTTFQSMKLFMANPSKEMFLGRMYYFKIYDNGTLVRDFIPVLDWDMKPCMYDRVSGDLFYNEATSGDFVAGRQIHPVEYLESTGTQYIDTGIYGKEDLETELICQQLQRNTEASGKAVFGAYNDMLNSYYLYQQGGEPNWQVGFGNFVNTSTEVDTDKHTFEFRNYKVYMDGVEIASLNSGSMNTTPYTLLLFNIHNRTGGIYNALPQRFYRATFVKSGVLIGDFIPAIDENDTFFMFDKITHTAYNNAGSGSFIGPTVAKDEQGKIVEPEYE